jgi:hypothetical protein
MKAFLKCNEATHVCDKAQYEEAGLWEKLWMKLHHFMCRLCRQHAVRNTKLTALIKGANLKTLSPEEKERIKERLQREL